MATVMSRLDKTAGRQTDTAVLGLGWHPTVSETKRHRKLERAKSTPRHIHILCKHFRSLELWEPICK